MSIKMTSLVLESLSLKPTNRCVMICLADFSDDDGVSWPSYSTIARKSGISESTAKRAIKALAQDGWISINKRHRYHNGKPVSDTNEYMLNIGMLVKDAYQTSEISGSKLTQGDVNSTLRGVVSNSTGGGVKTEGGVVSQVTPDPLKDPLKDPLSNDLAPSESLDAEIPLFQIPLCRKGKFLGVTDSDIQELSEAYPAVDVRIQIKRMILWLNNNPQRRKGTPKGVRRFIQYWLAKEQDRGRYLPPETQPKPVKSDKDELQAKIRQLEMDIDNENQYLVRVTNLGGTEQAIDASKSKIKRLSDERSKLLEQLNLTTTRRL
ncbi:hypothetical protein CTH30272_04108 [Allocatenococcus thiocycli]|nr:hypothetical protein CTH30272_04108 [Catenococcus thiocycli]